jgi:hypothetical protein
MLVSYVPLALRGARDACGTDEGDLVRDGIFADVLLRSALCKATCARRGGPETASETAPPETPAAADAE